MTSWILTYWILSSETTIFEVVLSLIIADSSSSNDDFFASSSVTLEGTPWISFWTGQLSSGFSKNSVHRLIITWLIKLCLVAKSAGLTSPGTKRPHSVPTNDRIFITLFSSNCYNTFLNPLIQYNAISEPDHIITDPISTSTSTAFLTYATNFDNNKQTNNSNLDNVTAFKGATLLLAFKKFTTTPTDVTTLT